MNFSQKKNQFFAKRLEAGKFEIIQVLDDYKNHIPSFGTPNSALIKEKYLSHIPEIETKILHFPIPAENNPSKEYFDEIECTFSHPKFDQNIGERTQKLVIILHGGLNFTFF